MKVDVGSLTKPVPDYFIGYEKDDGSITYFTTLVEDPLSASGEPRLRKNMVVSGEAIQEYLKNYGREKLREIRQ